jgi:hypothetical protein
MIYFYTHPTWKSWFNAHFGNDIATVHWASTQSLAIKLGIDLTLKASDDDKVLFNKELKLIDRSNC